MKLFLNTEARYLITSKSVPFSCTIQSEQECIISKKIDIIEVDLSNDKLGLSFGYDVLIDGIHRKFLTLKIGESITIESNVFDAEDPVNIKPGSYNLFVKLKYYLKEGGKIKAEILEVNKIINLV